MSAISLALGARRRTLRTNKSASSRAQGTREVVGRLRVCDCHRAAQAERLELLDGERRQGGLGLVLVFSDQKDDAGAVVGLELEWRPAGQLGGEDRGSDVLLDVLDDAVGSLEMADVGPLARVIHRVGQVADQDHVLARSGEVAQAERAGRARTYSYERP